MYHWKIKRLKRTAQVYLLENNVKGECQFGLVVVHISTDLKDHKLKFLENITI